MSKLNDGFSTLVTFASNPTVKLWEKEVTPPGLSGGGGIDITTMRNTAWRTMSPKKLKSLTNMTLTAAYDPKVYDHIMAMIGSGSNQLITVTFSDGSTLKFYGFIDEFKPGPSSEGEQPTAEVTIIPTLTDASGNEVAPDYDPAGTTTG